MRPWWLRHAVQDEEGGDDGNTGGTGGGDGGDKGSQAPDLSKTVTAVAQQVETLTKAMQLMATGQAQSQAQMQALAEAIAKGGEKPDEKKPDPNAPLFDGVDLEGLDRSQFGTLLLTKFMERLEAHMEGKLKPVLDEIGTVKNTVTKDIGERSIANAAANNKDLYEWKDEISNLLKESPGLSLPRALAIARSENPTKTQAMAKKYGSGGDGEKKEQKWLSLTPTSRTGGTETGGGKMKFHDAAERAFDDVVASFGGQSFDQLMKH
jgi:type VI protein secretion system component VasK